MFPIPGATLAEVLAGVLPPAEAYPFSSDTGPLLLSQHPVILTGYAAHERLGGGLSDVAATGVSGAFAAAAAGSESLAATDSLTGFDVTVADPAAQVQTTVTVSNVTGGPYVYDLTERVAGESIVSVRYPLPLAPAGGAPTVAIAAIVGGGAGHISVYGQAAGALTQFDLLSGTTAAGQRVSAVAMLAGRSVSAAIPGGGVLCKAGLYAGNFIGTFDAVAWAVPLIPG